MPVQHPLAMLHQVLQRSDMFRELFVTTVQCSGYKIHVWMYSDEITPGNVLSANSLRKTQAIYWTIRELGFPALHCEECWFTICAVRSSIVQEVQAGMGQVYRELMKLFFGRPTKHDLRGPSPVLLYIFRERERELW